MVGGVSEFTLVCTEDLLAFLSLVPIHLALRPQERHLDVDFRPKNCKQKLMRQSERKITNHFIVQNINNTLDPLRLLYSKICVSASVHLGMFSFSIFLIGANINSKIGIKANNDFKFFFCSYILLNISFEYISNH